MKITGAASPVHFVILRENGSVPHIFKATESRGNAAGDTPEAVKGRVS